MYVNSTLRFYKKKNTFWLLVCNFFKFILTHKYLGVKSYLPFSSKKNKVGFLQNYWICTCKLKLTIPIMILQYARSSHFFATTFASNKHATTTTATRRAVKQIRSQNICTKWELQRIHEVFTNIVYFNTKI